MKHRILLVDDDVDYVEMAQAYLGAQGLEHLAVHSIGEAREVLTRNEKIDLVLLDFNLPDQSGLEFIPEIKAYDPDLPIIMVSAQSETQLVVKAIQEGASDYVVKPFEFDELLEKLKKLLDVSDLKQTESELMQAKSESKLLGQSRQIKNLIHEISKVANSDSPVILYGESGTGKSLVAEIIHENSMRKDESLVTVNCAAIPSELLESEFFGHEKGSFTGAIRDKVGKFEYANHGSIFLDEIGDLALDLQAKLLRVLQGSEFERVGGLKTIHVDVRVVAATNRDLQSLIQDRKFREDLYYRLNVLPIQIPSLRERRVDIPILVNHFVHYFSRKANKKLEPISDAIMDMFLEYEWPGNIRELQNVIERAVVLSQSSRLRSSDFMIQNGKRYQPSDDLSRVQTVTTLKDIEKGALIKALEETGGNVSKASTLLNISRDTIYRRLKKYNIGLK